MQVVGVPFGHSLLSGLTVYAKGYGTYLGLLRKLVCGNRCVPLVRAAVGTGEINSIQ